MLAVTRRLLTITLLAIVSAIQQLAHATDEARSIAGIWMPDPARSERPHDLPFTDAGKAAVDEFRASHHPVKDDPGAFCLPAGMPQTAMGGADYPVEVIVTPRQVTFLYELHQQVRRVYLDKQSHPNDFVPQRNGHSIGRWEDGTLVIETGNLKRVPFGAVPHSEQTRIRERVRAVDGGETLVNDITVTDPVTYTRPVTIKQYYKAAPPDVRMFEYDCTEGLYADHLEARKAPGR